MAKILRRSPETIALAKFFAHVTLGSIGFSAGCRARDRVDLKGGRR